jgi:predicted acetyltransferase
MSSVQGPDIELVKPTGLYKDAILDYKDEFKKNSEYISGSASLGSADSFETWLGNIEDEQFNNPKAKRVPATQYLAVRKSDKKLVGMVSIRHKLNDYLEQFGGHVGYSVRTSERRKGYATQILKLALAYCRTLGISSVLVTCDKENIGSATVIRLNGGRLEDEVMDDDGHTTQRYWIDLH